MFGSFGLFPQPFLDPLYLYREFLQRYVVTWKEREMRVSERASVTERERERERKID